MVLVWLLGCLARVQSRPTLYVWTAGSNLSDRRKEVIKMGLFSSREDKIKKLDEDLQEQNKRLKSIEELLKNKK